MLWLGVKKIWIFVRFWSCWENPSKSLGAAEKKQEKDEANCAGFSAVFFGFQSVETICWIENLNVDNFLPELDISGALSF